MVKNICFVTGNQTKILHARVALEKSGILVSSEKVEMIEPREEEPEAVASQKAVQAFRALGKPLMTEDSGVFIRALNGFPKTFVHFVQDTIGVDMIIKMMEGVTDRYAEFHQALAYMEPGLDEPKVLSYADRGFTVADSVWREKAQTGWGDFDRILIPPGETKPLCTFSPEWRAKRDAEANEGRIHYQQLEKWLKGRKT